MTYGHYAAKLTWEAINTIGLGLIGAGLASIMLDTDVSALLGGFTVLHGIAFVVFTIDRRADLLVEEDKNGQQ